MVSRGIGTDRFVCVNAPIPFRCGQTEAVVVAPRHPSGAERTDDDPESQGPRVRLWVEVLAGRAIPLAGDPAADQAALNVERLADWCVVGTGRGVRERENYCTEERSDRFTVFLPFWFPFLR